MATRFSRNIVSFAFAAAASLAAGYALAQTPPAACTPDIQSYCAGVQQGEGRIAKCLRAHDAKVSPACKQAMMRTAELVKEVVGACEDDIHRYCSGAAPGTTKECLRQNLRELSFGCKRELFEAKKGM
jgi:Golgi apparatus protein 1